VARTRRRFSGKRRGPRRPVDWVTSLGGYSLGLEPILVPDGSVNVQVLANHRDVQMTNLDAAAPAEGGFRYFENDYVVERVVGSIWCWILPASSWWDTLTGRTQLITRIGVTKQFIPPGSGSDVITPIPYVADFRTVAAGNDDFMWEGVELFVAQSAWGDMQVDPTMYVRRMDVDIRVKRKLQHGDALYLAFQAGPGLDYSGAETAFPDMACDPRLRVLLSTR